MESIAKLASSFANRGSIKYIDSQAKWNSKDFTPMFQAIGNARVVLIGEASHGTQEFYQMRAEITKTLIRDFGFTFVAVEADWPDAYRVNRYVHQSKNNKDQNAEQSLSDFKRFPVWMWRNKVMVDFIEWMKDYNLTKSKNQDKTAFYGLDLYSMYSSMDAVIEYLRLVSPEDAAKAAKNYSNFERFQGQPSAYGAHAGLGLEKSFEKEVVQTLVTLQQKGESYLKGIGGLIDGDELFYATKNAELVKNAEEYYRNMYSADENTWNLRDSHMSECLMSLLDYHQDKFPNKFPKAIVWAHNSHIGDARASDRKTLIEEWNVGQLIREALEKRSEQCFNIGFSTFKGSVTAANQWDEPAEYMRVRNGMYHSYEHLCHQLIEDTKQDAFYAIFRSNGPYQVDPSLLKIFEKSRHERYIGVIYRPLTEKASHYQLTSLTKEYDALIYIDRTHALEPIDYHPQWVHHREQYSKIKFVDTDPYPELEGAELSTKDISLNPDWWMKAIAEITQIGNACFANQMYPEALSKYHKSLMYLRCVPGINREDAEGLRRDIAFNRACVHIQQGRWHEALKDCKYLSQQRPQDPEVQKLTEVLYTHAKEQEKPFESLFAPESKLELPKIHLDVKLRNLPVMTNSTARH